MRNIDAGLVTEAEIYVMKLLEEWLPKEYLFHSKAHTLNVLNNAAFIGEQSGFTEHEMNILRLSALFHDTGYTKTAENHEEESSSIAVAFLRKNQVAPEDTEKVLNAILATKVPQNPNDRISEVLCDADLLHLTSADYFEQMELLRREWQETGRFDFTEYQFHLNSIDFFIQHHYHSDYGKRVMEALKESTLNLIRNRINPGI